MLRYWIGVGTYTVITKSCGIERDLDLLAAAAQRQQVYVMVSITTLDAVCRASWNPADATRTGAFKPCVAWWMQGFRSG